MQEKGNGNEAELILPIFLFLWLFLLKYFLVSYVSKPSFIFFLYLFFLIFNNSLYNNTVSLTIFLGNFTRFFLHVLLLSLKALLHLNPYDNGWGCMEQKHFFSISRKPYVHKTHFPFTAPFYFKSLRYRRLMLENGTGNEAELILTISGVALIPISFLLKSS